LEDKPDKMTRIIRILVAAFFGVLGLTVGLYIVLSGFLRLAVPRMNLWLEISAICVITVLLSIIGFLMGPLLIKQTKWLIRWGESQLVRIPTADLIGAVFGLIIGLIIASLLGPSMSGIPFVGRYLHLLISILLGYLGFSLGMQRREELTSFSTIRNLISRERRRVAKQEEEESASSASAAGLGAAAAGSIPVYACAPKILDTSVIIDGRVSDIYQTGFIAGKVIVPRFVLIELQHIADSSDGLKRNRGRRGLDILNSMHKDMQGVIHIDETDFPDTHEVDVKLIMLARQLGGEILTNDYNLNKVAELQGVRVLNINDLVNALKPVYLPGEEMIVHVTKEGKEQRQGIGYLDDGTMIVVETGKKYINQSIHTIVTSVLQTSAGRMIFVKPKYTDKRVYVEEKD